MEVVMTLENPRDAENPLAAALILVLNFARSAEKIAFALALLTDVMDIIGDLAEVDEALTPELRAALDHAKGSCDALGRAFAFVNTRLEVFADQADDPPTDEGGST